MYMRKTVKAYAIKEKGRSLEPFEYKLGKLEPEQVDIEVTYCGVCHSDLSLIKNDWGITTYPLVPGHEVVGTVVGLGDQAKGLKIGDTVGLGWFSASCMHCRQCLYGNHNMCLSLESTILGRHGGFASRVRCHWVWATPLPEGFNLAKAGPLLCAGSTVFNPIVNGGVKPLDRVGVIGIGGLGHLALQFLSKWGCEVTAFTSSPDKAAMARNMGATHIVNSRDEEAMDALRGTFDFILNTTNANLNWSLYLNALSRFGTLHTVGAVPDPIPVPAFSIMGRYRSVSGSPVGSPALTRDMISFCQRHDIYPITEEFALSDINDALEHLESGKARYRIVLKVK